MKILMIFTSKFHRTGITMVVMNYYRELIKKKNIYIDFLLPNNPETDFKDEIIKNQSNIFVIDMSIRRTRPFKYIETLKNILLKEKYDIVHIHGSSSIMSLELIASKEANIKTRIVHSHNTKTEHPIINKVLYPYFKKNYTDAFACGREAGKWLFKESDYTIIPNAQNFEEYIFNSEKRAEYRKKFNLNNYIVIGHVGAFNYQKNQEFIIEIASKMKNKEKYKFVLIGDGPKFELLKEKIKKQKLEQLFILTGKTNKVNEWLNAMDVMILPSKYEGFPNVLVEWQISGLKSIVSNKVSKEVKVTDLIEFLPLKSDVWAKAIENISVEYNRNNLLYLNKLKEKGFDIKTSADRLYNKYIELINERENS